MALTVREMRPCCPQKVAICNFQQSWNDFERIYKMYAGKQLDRQKQLELGRALQLVKEKNQELINEVRRQY